MKPVCVYCSSVVAYLVIDPDLVPSVAMCKDCYKRIVHPTEKET